jgi:hypothetical protein
MRKKDERGRFVRTHGHACVNKISSEYKSWLKMRERCTNPNCKDFPNYGGAGIKVCDRWLNSFENFLDDMGPKPSPKHSIDRYPNQKGWYEKNNCRWATPTEQARNVSKNRLLEYKGQIKPVSQWCEELGLSDSCVESRLKKGELTVEQIFEIPSGGLPRKKRNFIEFNGVTLSITEWSKKLGMRYQLIQKRLRVYGWSIEDTLSIPAGKQRPPHKANNNFIPHSFGYLN